MPKKSPSLYARFRRVRMPQALIVVAIIAGFCFLATSLPDDRWGSVARIVVGILSALGIGGTVAPGLLRTEDEADAKVAIEAPPPPPPPPSRRGGFAEVDLLLFVLAAAVLAASTLLHGCGASALRSHATATVIATIAVSSAEDVYLAHLDASQGECSDEACIDAARSAHRPAESAIALARVAVRAYRDAVEIASEADETQDLLAALVTAALRLVARWGEVVAAMAGLGVDVPPLPIGLPS